MPAMQPVSAGESGGQDGEEEPGTGRELPGEESGTGGDHTREAACCRLSSSGHHKGEDGVKDSGISCPATHPCWIMGNHTGKDSHSSTGSPLDFFHTPPTTPSESELAAMALSSAASTSKAQQNDTASPETAGSSSPPSFSTSPVTEWTQKLSIPSEWAVISVDCMAPPERNASDAAPAAAAAAKQGKAAVGLGSPVSLSSSKGSNSERSWQERDSGLEPQAAAEQAGEEMTLVLLSLMEHYRASVGLTNDQDVTTGSVELLRRLITERDELLKEVHSLRETLRAERVEWQQFQCDLQVAVSVADRLRMESEQALGVLQESHRSLGERLTQALGREQGQARELESLRAEHRDTYHRLSELTLQHQQDHAELDALRNACRVKDVTDSEEDAERKDSDRGHSEKHKQGEEMLKELEENTGDVKAENQEEIEANQGVDAEDVGHDPEEENGAGGMQVTGRGVAEGYLRRLAAMEKRKEDGRGPRDPRRIVMLSERSWSLSRLPLPTDSPTQNGTSQNTSTTLPLCKKEEPTKGRRMDRILQRQDSWSSFYTRKQEDEQSSDSSKPQDGFSALLRRHGGSRRNSLLRWCQSRTQGYKNIEITNFSSSWEDGLAFCAVYHTYLPTHVAYSSLNPADKKENLSLAFQTGESVGITATLTLDEMLKAGGPDWQRVLGYVESIFRHFEM